MQLATHGFHRIILQTVWGIATRAKQTEKTGVDVVVRMPNFPLGEHSPSYSLKCPSLAWC